MKINHKKINKKYISITLILLLLVVTHFTVIKKLSITWYYMKQAPLTIPYTVGCVIVLFLLGKIPFFKGIQLLGNSVTNKASTSREVLVTVVYGLLLFAMIIGFFAVLLNQF